MPPTLRQWKQMTKDEELTELCCSELRPMCLPRGARTLCMDGSNTDPVSWEAAHFRSQR